MIRKRGRLWFARHLVLRRNGIFSEPLSDRFPFCHSLLPVNCPIRHQTLLPETTRLFLGPLSHLAVRISKINSVHEGGIPYRAVPADPEVVRRSGRNAKVRCQEAESRTYFRPYSPPVAAASNDFCRCRSVASSV